MDSEVRFLAHQLLHGGVRALDERERRVIARVARRVHTARNVNQVFEERLTFGERLADKVAAVGGSWRFIIGFAVFLVGWAAVNTVAAIRLDPYPFIFLNLLLSMLAAVQAPVIMMSQNRQAAKDRLEAALDYEVNVKAETAIAELHEKMDRVLADLEALRGGPAAPPVAAHDAAA
ncbi:MAG TPA: DUF1003 domain-containing protein [Hyphomicrobiales bacterium]|nr:DUF1003 domain-containing protein [Hyphomicrobiales bacterium]